MDACFCGMYVCICMYVICTCVCICECIHVRVCMHVYVCILTHVCKSVEARRGTGSSEVHGLAGGCSELPHVSTENQTLSSTRTVTDSSVPLQTRVRYAEYQVAQKSRTFTSNRRQFKLPVLLSLLPLFNISLLYFCL